MREIGTSWDRDNRNIMNDNFRESKNRVDNLIKNTPQPSEVVDIRVDEEGTIHTTAKERIDAEALKRKEKDDELTAQLAQMPTQEDLTNAVTPKADKTYVDNELTQKATKGEITKNDLDTSTDGYLLDLNNFNESTRAVLQGLAPGSVNAVLGKENVVEENIAYGALNIEKIKDVEIIVGTNLFLKQNAVPGAIDVTTGDVAPSEIYMVTDFIPVQPGEKITSMSGLNTHVYTPEKTYRQSWQNTQTITVPTNGAWYRTTLNKADLDTFIVVRGESIPPEDERIPNKYRLPTLELSSDNLEGFYDNLLYGIKWAALGDSITVSSGSGTTVETGYVNLIATRNKMTAYNFGYNGSSITKNPDMNGYQFTQRYLSMPDDADIVTVFGGTNDYGHNLPLGNWGDTTDDTLYGAMKILIEGLMVKYPTKRIGFILPLPRVGNIGQTGGLKDYVAVIKDVCSRYSMPVLDLYNESGFAPDFEPNKNALMYDGLHPTPEGQLLMSRKIEAFLRRL